MVFVSTRISLCHNQIKYIQQAAEVLHIFPSSTYHASFSSSVSTNWPRSRFAMARISSSVRAKSNTSRFSLRRFSLRNRGMGVIPRCRSHRKNDCGHRFVLFVVGNADQHRIASSNNPIAFLPSGVDCTLRIVCLAISPVLRVRPVGCTGAPTLHLVHHRPDLRVREQAPSDAADQN